MIAGGITAVILSAVLEDDLLELTTTVASLISLGLLVRWRAARTGLPIRKALVGPSSPRGYALVMALIGALFAVASIEPESVRAVLTYAVLVTGWLALDYIAEDA